MTLEREHAKKLQELRQVNKEVLEKARQRMQADLELRLKAEREKFLSKTLGENHLQELQTQKDAAQRQSDLELRERKRAQEKASKEQLAAIKDRLDDDEQEQRVETKKRIQAKYERKEKAVELEIADVRRDF